MSDVRAWLETLGLERYADAFEREEVDINALPELTEADLASLGLPLGPRKMLIRAIGELRNGNAIAPLASPDTYTPAHLAEKILKSRSVLEGERKQVTVLFCDIADSTGLAAQVGAEVMHVILNRFFRMVLEEVHRYEGTVNQFLGDGLMALFGAPLAHEDHPRRAVLAALGIRHAIELRHAELDLPSGSRLSVRIGLHTGPVVVGSIGDNLRMDYTAIGDTTNLAARLQQAAGPGQILVSEATGRLVEGYANVAPIPPLAVKGKVELVVAFEVTAIGSRRSRLEQERKLSPFVGREREISVLQKALEETLSGRGQIVGIVGEPGVGKSRVLYEFRGTFGGRGVTCLEGWCQSFGQGIPYLPLQDLVRALVGIQPADAPGQVAERLEKALEGRGLAKEDAAYLLRLLAVDERSEALRGFTPEAVQSHTLDLLTRLLLARSREQPLVVTIEDLHWIDKSSEAFLVHFVESLPGAPILLLTTARPGYTAPWVAKSYATQLALHVLSDEASRCIVEATAVRSGVARATADAILLRAEGNPLFLEELTLALQAHRSEPDAQPLPDTIQGVLAARIDRLPEESKRTLQTAAVLGREFPLQLLNAITLDRNLDRQLGALKQLEFLYERNALEGPVYAFKHALTQEVAYESLLSGRKQALHEAAGRALEQFYPDRLEEHCELLAHHFLRSPAREKALDYLEIANRKAAKANAVADAKIYFEEAMHVLDGLAEDFEHRRRRIALLVEQIHVFVLTNGLFEFQQHLERDLPIAESLADDALLGHLHACRGHIQYMLGRSTEARPTLITAAELCERAGNYHGAAHAYAHLQWTHLQSGDYEQVLRVEDASLRALSQAPDMRLMVYTLTGSAYACAMLGRWANGLERGLVSLRESERARDPSLVSFSYSFGLAVVYRGQGDTERALDCSRRAVESSQTPAERQWAEVFYGWALSAVDAEAAIELLAPILEFYRSKSLDWLECFAAVPMGEACYRVGRYEQARQHLGRAVELGRQLGMNLLAAPAQRLLGEVLLSEGSAEVLPLAQGCFEQAMASLERSKAENELALAWMGYGQLQARLGQRKLAREYFSKALATFERLGTLGQPHRARAELAAL